MPDDEPERWHPDVGERALAPRTVFHIDSQRTDLTIGEVVLYNADLTNRTCWLSVGIDPAHRRRVWAWEGVFLALDWAFNRGMRQVYVESLEHIATAFDGAIRDGALVECGRLPEAIEHDGRYEDIVNYVIRRAAWDDYRQRFVGAFLS